MIIINGHLSKSSKSLSGPSTSSPSQSLDDSLSVLMLPSSLDLSWEIKSLKSSDRRPEAKTKKNTFSSSSLGWPPSPTPLYNGISRSLEGECGMGGFAELSWTFSFWKCIIETGKTCARVVCVLGWWWWRRDWCPLPHPSTSSYGGCFLRPGRKDLSVSVYLVENHRVWFSVAAGNLTAGQHDITRYLPKRRPE